MFQGEQCPRRVVCVWNTAGQIRPRPAAGRGPGVGMHRAVLLGEEPIEDAPALLGAHHLVNARAKGVDGERRHPRREVGVNRPTPVRAHGL